MVVAPRSADDPVDSAAALRAGLVGAHLPGPGGLDCEPELLLERAGDGAADRVVLPAGGRGDLLDGRALGPLEQLDHPGLLGAGARGGLFARPSLLGLDRLRLGRRRLGLAPARAGP